MLVAAIHLSGIVFTQADGTQHGWPLKKEVIYIVSKNLQRAQNVCGFKTCALYYSLLHTRHVEGFVGCVGSTVRVGGVVPAQHAGANKAIFAAACLLPMMP